MAMDHVFLFYLNKIYDRGRIKYALFIGWGPLCFGIFVSLSNDLNIRFVREEIFG